MMSDGFGFGMGYGASWVFWVLMIILIIWLYSVLINRKDEKNISHNKKQVHQTPIEILKQRYAAGEIDEDEYKQGLNQLRKDVMP